MRALDHLTHSVLFLEKDIWDIGALSDIRDEFLFFVPESDPASPIASTHEPDIFSTEIKSDYHLEIAPLLNQSHLIRRQARNNGFVRPMPKFRSECFLELNFISLTSETINHPYHRGMKNSAFSDFLRFDGGMLDFYHETVRYLNIRNMELASLVAGGNLLQISREAVLPRSVPIGFGLPPIVAVTLSLVSPVPDLLRTASRDQLCTTPRAEPDSAGSGLHSFIFSKCKFHFGDISLERDSNKVDVARYPSAQSCRRDPLWQMPYILPVCHRSFGNRIILAMSPDPSRVGHLKSLVGSVIKRQSAASLPLAARRPRTPRNPRQERARWLGAGLPPPRQPETPPSWHILQDRSSFLKRSIKA